MSFHLTSLFPLLLIVQNFPGVDVEIIIEGPSLGKSALCEPILRALPEWFGIEAAIVHYAQTIDDMPTYLAHMNGQAVGFLTIKQHFEHSAEIYVMGVLSHAHRQGVGRKLVQMAERTLRQQGIEYLQVKTLSPANPSLEYAQTRAFYLAMGFRPLEEFPTLWDEHNPCLLMVKSL
jgi:ribosomal protein S18 acetylase RimI-like enzyme